MQHIRITSSHKVVDRRGVDVKEHFASISLEFPVPKELTSDYQVTLLRQKAGAAMEVIREAHVALGRGAEAYEAEVEATRNYYSVLIKKAAAGEYQGILQPALFELLASEDVE